MHGAAAMPWSALGCFAAFAFVPGAVWGWFLGKDRKRLLVATLTGAIFGLIHIDSYGLVLVTTGFGTILAYVSMHDRTRNLAALGCIHGFLGTTFGALFKNAGAGALRVDYRVGPGGVEEPAAAVLIIPALCLAGFAALAVWAARTLKEADPVESRAAASATQST
jgi:membrane protease YdiL (CAAX protease family)